MMSVVLQWAVYSGPKVNVVVACVVALLLSLQTAKAGEFTEDILERQPFLKGMEASQVGATYDEKLKAFERGLLQQVEGIALPMIRNNEKMSEKQKQQVLAVTVEVRDRLVESFSELRRLYKVLYTDRTAKADTATVLHRIEVDANYLAVNLLVSLIKLSDRLDRGWVRFGVSRYVSTMQKQIKKLDMGVEIDLFFWSWLSRVSPMVRGTWYTMKAMIVDILIKNVNISEASRFLDHTKLGHDDEPINIVGWQPDKQSLPENAAVVIALNHDHGVLDGRVIGEINERLGIANSMIVTTRVAWPNLSIRDSKDPNTFFIEDGLYLRDVINRMVNFDQGKISFGILPEGFIPQWQTQMPLTVKRGAFYVARRAAYMLQQNKPVYFIEGQTNGLAHITRKEPFEVVLRQPELVPTDALRKYDPWIESKRAEFEWRTNLGRGLYIADVDNRAKVDGTYVNQVATISDVPSSSNVISEVRCELVFLSN